MDREVDECQPPEARRDDQDDQQRQPGMDGDMCPEGLQPGVAPVLAECDPLRCSTKSARKCFTLNAAAKRPRLQIGIQWLACRLMPRPLQLPAAIFRSTRRPRAN
jgi:hypothetical protein